MQMESTWYLKPGQTLENTKIEDRGHALRFTKKAWGGITKHLDRNRLMQETLEKEEARKLALKKGSEEMTKDWDNSVENIRIRKEEERQTRIQKDKDDKMQRFFKMRKEQAGVREKYINDAKKTMYISKGHPKNLTGALILSEVLYEREKQHELDKKIKDYETEQEAIYAQKVKDGALQEQLEKAEKQRKIHEKSLEIRDIYLKDMQEKAESIQKQKEQKVEKEKLDIVFMEKEFAKIKQIEYEEEQTKIANVKKEFNDFWIKQQQVKEQMAQEEKEQNLVIDIYSKAKHNIECLRIKKVKEMQAAMQLRREAASRKAVADAKAKSGNEERLLREAEAERERQEVEKLIAKAKNREQLVKERNEDRQVFLKREEKRLFEEAELKKWQMLNRYKSDELTKQYEIDKKNKIWQATLKYRADLFKQMAEEDEIRQKNKEEDDNIYKEALEKIQVEDDKFFSYANEVYELAKKRGRRTSPIKRVIDNYKKEYNLPRNIVRVCDDYQPQYDKIKKGFKCPQHNPEG